VAHDPITPTWRVVDSSYVLETPFFRLRRDAIAQPGNDATEDYYVRESRGFAVIFATTEDDRLILVREYKHGIGAEILALPAGAIDQGETPLECAIRELREETGHEATGGVTFIRSFIAEPSNSNAHFSLFHAVGAVPSGVQAFDPLERIVVELVPVREAVELTRTGRIDVGSHVAALYTMFDRLGVLR
jgi:8-oxo-dGTP pyrophosphatase MutT (NUDIX family)